MNPISSLLRSRKFLLLVADAVVSTALMTVGHLQPDLQPLVEQVIAIIQPVIIAVIVGITLEDSAEKFNGS